MAFLSAAASRSDFEVGAGKPVSGCFLRHSSRIRGAFDAVSRSRRESGVHEQTPTKVGPD